MKKIFLSRHSVIAGSVVLLHLGALWLLQTGLIQRAVAAVLPVEILSELIEPPVPKNVLPPPAARKPVWPPATRKTAAPPPIKGQAADAHLQPRGSQLHLNDSLDRNDWVTRCLRSSMDDATAQLQSGLAVAIPAVLGYNALVRGNKCVIGKLNRFAYDLHALFVTGSRIGSSSAFTPGSKVLPIRKA